MKPGNIKNYYSGTSGLALSIPKRMFPPEFQNNSRLHYYASLFNSLEVNSSFYKVPMGATVAKWNEEVPGDFKFTYKMWKGITHNKKLDFNPADVDSFMNTIDHAGDKKGCLLIQFPASTDASNIKQLQHLIKCIKNADPQRHWLTAVEFRNTSWYVPDTYSLLNNNNIGMVVHDYPSSVTPVIDDTSGFIYLRFHGVKGDYREPMAMIF